MTKLETLETTSVAPTPPWRSEFTSTISEHREGRGGPSIVVLSNVAGTGAVLTDRVIRVLVSTGGGPVYALSLPRLARPDADKAPPSPARTLARVRSALSVTITELASILRVERPTIYAWLAERAEPRLQNRRRLAQLLSIADVWAELSSEPLGDAVRWQDASGSSIVDLLRRDDFDAAVERLRAIASVASERRPTARDNRLERLRLFAQRHGQPQDSRDEQEALDVETGKRMNPE